MKRALFGIAAAACFAQGGSAAAEVLFSETFEADQSQFSLSSDFIDSTNDYFAVVGTGDISTVNDYTGFGGSSFFAAEDTDDNGGNGNDIQTLTFTVDITGATDLSFSGLFAESGGANYDALDSIVITGSIDAGASFNILAFETVQDGDAFNSAVLSQDTDFDGEGDGTALSEEFSTFTGSITGTGSSLTVEIAVFMDSASEEIAFDNLVIEGVIPEPASLALVGLGGLAMLGRGRRRA
ncbi:PEP-CTERM sorting domain-containing protein [Algisphaera agarilytica]|uniref:Ice-binding protein C-terminal domain-containing protein n=1 Tax=Algisphaera agarilytica TaxID=1385975 RepID=A0A7X0H5J3_9BACT|nr:PEP-CTERM sorting domain-containing protein [Algisphaera agarilytica]MBB6429683.1 hypothetical protein [Algisphaera agarilytica]